MIDSGGGALAGVWPTEVPVDGFAAEPEPLGELGLGASFGDAPVEFGDLVVLGTWRLPWLTPRAVAASIPTRWYLLVSWSSKSASAWRAAR